MRQTTVWSVARSRARPRSRSNGSVLEAIEIAWHVAEFSSGVTVQRGRTVKDADTPATATVTLASAIDLGSTFVLATSAFAGGGFGHNDWHRFYLSDASTLTIDAPGAGSDNSNAK
ncbi:hypothetical protein ACFL6C_02175 [Myxococcota bacterium]